MKVLKKVGKILLILVLVLAILGGVGYAFRASCMRLPWPKCPATRNSITRSS